MSKIFIWAQKIMRKMPTGVIIACFISYKKRVQKKCLIKAHLPYSRESEDCIQFTLFYQSQTIDTKHVFIRS